MAESAPAPHFSTMTRSPLPELTGILRPAALTVLAASALSACAARQPALPPPPAPAVVPIVPELAPPPVPPGALQAGAADAPAPPLDVATGEATYYASFFDGRPTASGVVFRNAEPLAAHRTYPFGTLIRVVNQANGREVVVTVVDRGPHGTSPRAQRTIVDLSHSAAAELDMIRAGRAAVRVEVLRWGGG
jgi:hypothetical protein